MYIHVSLSGNPNYNELKIAKTNLIHWEEICFT